MRKIKFRGKRVDNGQYVYGDLLTGGNEFAIINDTVRAMVVPNSVAQLVGRDKHGKEIFEGDTLIHASGEEWIAALGSYARNKTGLATYNFKKLTLKEAQS